MKNKKAQYTTAEIIDQMARRIAYQFVLTKGADGDEKLCGAMQEQGFRELPKEWVKLANEWCKDHKISALHGVMALLHFKSIFGMDFNGAELRAILDEAFDEAKTIKIIKA